MIKNLIHELRSLDEYTWGYYTFRRDPIHNKVSMEKKREMIQRANECGRQAAISLKEKYGPRTCMEYAKLLRLKIIRLEDGDSRDYILFARFNSPDRISLYMKNVEKAEELIKEKNLRLLLDNIIIEDVLTAHEMFHFMECTCKDIYSLSEKILLWKIGPIKYHSGLVALGEIAAMAFAKELLQLSYYPNLFDILLLYPHNPKTAVALYNEVMSMRGDGLVV